MHEQFKYCDKFHQVLHAIIGVSHKSFNYYARVLGEPGNKASEITSRLNMGEEEEGGEVSYLCRSE